MVWNMQNKLINITLYHLFVLQKMADVQDCLQAHAILCAYTDHNPRQYYSAITFSPNSNVKGNAIRENM